MGAIRGAICANNTQEDISAKSVELVTEIFKANSIDGSDVQAIFFSATADLNACYPAKAVREQLNLDKAAFMCFTEMAVENSLAKCIRVCVFVDKLSQNDCKHCYLGEAKALRQDLK